MAAFQCLQDGLALEIGQTGSDPWRGAVEISGLEPIGIHMKRLADGYDHGALDNVFQFPDVPWPVIVHEQLHGGGTGRSVCFAHAPAEMVEKMPHQVRNIVWTLA